MITLYLPLIYLVVRQYPVSQIKATHSQQSPTFTETPKKHRPLDTDTHPQGVHCHSATRRPKSD